LEYNEGIMAKKRIYNPKTRKYYAIRKYSTKKGSKGQIIGSWKPPKKPKKKSNFWGW
jgi:hypothetical protein